MFFRLFLSPRQSHQPTNSCSSDPPSSTPDATSFNILAHEIIPLRSSRYPKGVDPSGESLTRLPPTMPVALQNEQPNAAPQAITEIVNLTSESSDLSIHSSTLPLNSAEDRNDTLLPSPEAEPSGNSDQSPRSCARSQSHTPEAPTHGNRHSSTRLNLFPKPRGYAGCSQSGGYNLEARMRAYLGAEFFTEKKYQKLRVSLFQFYGE